MKHSFLSRLAALAALAIVPGFAACAPDAAVDAVDEAADSGNEELSATARAYVTIRHDNRKCASPMCGGWFAKDVNKANPTERYVSDLDFTNTDFDDATMDLVRSAPEGELVLRAKLGPVEPEHNTRKLLVFEAYRGLPGQAPYVSDLFYSVTANDPAIQCITAPCNNLHAKKLNSTKTKSITATDIDFGALVDNAWLRHRVETGGALVAGEIYEGEVFPGGPEQLLFADQVYLKLPEVAGPCPAVKLAPCAEGMVRSYTRTEDRCVVPGACVEAGACAAVVPSCEEGYELSSWNGGMFACTQFVCDPAWLFSSEEQ